MTLEDFLKAKRVIVVIAHPDDEPGGTIAKLTQSGTDVSVICVTDGNSPGTKVKKLNDVRKKEFENCCNVLGVSQIHFLGFPDGGLCNANYHEVAQKIQDILEKEKPDTILTLDPRGLTGHLDHIAVSMITTFVFEKLKSVKNLYYFCMSERMRKLIPGYFVYMPKGYKKEEIDVTVDVRDVWKTKVNSMKCHISQMHDIKRILLLYAFLPKEEYFLKYRK